MRHFLAARPIAARPIGMREPPPAAALVTSSGRSHCAVPGACSSLRHNRFGRDHSSCRSGSGCGRRRTETAGQIEPRAAQPGRRHVDERHDCQDIGPAYVSSTVWGTASRRDRQVGIGAVLAPQGRNATPPLLATSGMGARQRPIAPDDLVTYPAIADMLFRQRASRRLNHPATSGTPRQICADRHSRRHQAWRRQRRPAVRG